MKPKQLQPAEVQYLAVHTSATPTTMDIGAQEIDLWHRKKGWRKIGYHYVIRRNGLIENGRDTGEFGAHVKGYNDISLGICMIGGIDKNGKPRNNYTKKQFESLRALLLSLTHTFPNATIQGHRDFPNVHKDCPCFDVKKWVEENL